jgi:DNA relaxase NicK
MQTRLDWLSFTLPIDYEPHDAAQAQWFCRAALTDIGSNLKDLIFANPNWEYGAGRAPYKYGFSSPNHDIMMYVGSNTSTVLYELSGRFWERCTDLDVVKDLLLPIKDNVTRIDVSTDMETKTRPTDFANSRTKGNSLSVGYLKSPDGETVYLGSMKSDRYARIYRYEHPHPRSDLLRFEVVYRRDFSKSLAEAILQAAHWSDLAQAVERPYKFAHPDWKIGEQSDLRVELARTTREEDTTVIWLYKTCAPSLARLVAAGAVDRAHFMEHLDKLIADISRD